MDDKEVRSTALDLALTYLATIRNPEGTLKTKPEEVEVIAERFVAFINKK